MGVLVLVLALAFAGPSQCTRNQPSATSQCSPKSPVAAHETMPAPSLGGATLPYRILLPADYATGTSRYPALYLLHGLGDTENDWWERTHLADYAARIHLIIVTPGVGDSWYANSASN